MHKTRLRVSLAAVPAVLAVTASLTAAGAAQASTLPTLSIAITPSSATVGGARESGAVNVVSTDTGVKEASVILFLLKPGASVAEAEAFTKEKKAANDPNNASKFGSIVFDTEGSPGQTGEAQTDLQPGQYVVLVGAGEGAVQVRTSFTVSAAKSPVALPAPQATIRSIEFAFRGPSTLHDGELVRFENEGFLVHMDIAFPVKNAKTAKRVVKLLLAGKEKGARKARLRTARHVRRTAIARSTPAGDDHRQARHLRAGVLHGHPGRAQPHPAGHGAHHQDHEVEVPASKKLPPCIRGWPLVPASLGHGSRA